MTRLVILNLELDNCPVTIYSVDIAEISLNVTLNHNQRTNQLLYLLLHEL